jgi:hypothetical protein
MRDRAAAEEEKRAEAKRVAVEEACKRLRPLADPARSWSIVNWNDQARSPKAEFMLRLHLWTPFLTTAPPTTS